MLPVALLAAPAGMLLTSQTVMAQGDSLLEEIIVTARKREENVLEIPESLTTFTGDLVERANINGLEDIGLLVPNLWMSGVWTVTPMSPCAVWGDSAIPRVWVLPG